MGLFIFTIWVLHFGYSGLAGSFALACLMLPIVIRSTYEMLRLVPDSLREASYALGATKARVTLTVVLPAAIGGIVSGALLAVARAAGETAPLLFTILTVESTQHEPVQRPQHLAVHADLRERDAALRRRAGPRLGLGADAHRNRVHPDDRRPPHHRPVRPVRPLGEHTMEPHETSRSPLSRQVAARLHGATPTAARRRPRRSGRRSSTRRTSPFTTGRSGPSRTSRCRSTRTRSRRSSDRPAAARRPCCGR